MKSEDVKDCTIFLTVAGSRAYGINTDDSDYDYRGVCIPKDHSYYIGMGLDKFEQKEKGWDDESDKVIYDFRKFLKLASDNNPNILELLFIDEKFWTQSYPIWEKVLNHRDKFLSKKTRFTYGGYAYAQLKRIQRHRGYLMNPPKEKPERANFSLPDKNLISSDQMGAFQWLLAKTLENSVEMMKLSDTTKEELKKINYIGAIQSNIPDECSQAVKEITKMPDKWIEAVMKEKGYQNALNNWNAYHSWKINRNEKRQKLEEKYKFDTKHATHLVRLMRMGMEILETGQVNVYRHDREELKAIRNGAWTYEQVVEYAEQSEVKLTELYKTSILPKEPNRKFINKLCQEIIYDYANL